jgi:hypothetical protein
MFYGFIVLAIQKNILSQTQFLITLAHKRMCAHAHMHKHSWEPCKLFAS